MKNPETAQAIRGEGRVPHMTCSFLLGQRAIDFWTVSAAVDAWFLDGSLLQRVEA